MANKTFLEQAESPISVISWHSGKLARVARRSNSAEVQAAAEAEGELSYIRLSMRELVGETIPLHVNSISPIQQNSMKNGYDENKGCGNSYENKCATNYSIITNNNWNNTRNKQLTMHNKYTNDDVHTDDCVVHIMRSACT